MDEDGIDEVFRGKDVYKRQGEGSYGTQGSTSGWGFGAMYELTYDVYLNENRSSVCAQRLSW